MDAKGNTFETGFLNLVLNNIALAGIGDAGGLPKSVADGSLFVALHTASPGEAGTQATSECAWTGYARQPVARDPVSPKWTVAAGNASNANAVAFSTCTANPETATHFSVGVAVSGATMILFYGALTTPVSIGVGVTPLFPVGQLTGAEQ